MESPPYPKSVILICANEFFERFTFYGTRTTLPLFLKDGLGYSEDTATVIFHSFFTFSYFTPLIGASISDCYIGNYKTILYFTFVYIIGSALLAVSAIPPLPLPYSLLAILGMALIALGSGGIKPCITTFGGDQFQLPMQLAKQLAYFAIFNWIIAAANLSATFVAPIFRADVKCFGEDSCHSLMFLVALAFLILSLAFLVAGKTLYTVRQPAGNILARVAKCIKTALVTNFKSRSSKNTYSIDGQRRNHWLDSSTEEHGSDLVDEIKVVLRLLPLYIPLCFFWALYDQQSSRWTFQATRMQRNIFGFSVQPDQFQVINRILILLLIPLFEKVIYPILGKCGLLKSLLTRIFWGGICAAVAFLLSGLLEIQLRGSTQEEPKLHIGWQMPQIVMIVVAEILFQISGMEFSYTEAPKSMKSLMQAVWLLTSAVGNLIVVFVAEFKFFDKQEHEFFLFAGLMFLNMLIFALLCHRYNRRKKCSRAKNELSGVDNPAFTGHQEKYRRLSLIHGSPF